VARVSLLAAIAAEDDPNHASVDLAHILDLARTLDDPSAGWFRLLPRVQVLWQLAAIAPEADQPRLVDEAMTAVLAAGPRVLAKMLPNVGAAHRLRLWSELTQSFSELDSDLQVEAVEAVAPLLSITEACEAVVLTRHIKLRRRQGSVVAHLAQRLPPEVRLALAREELGIAQQRSGGRGLTPVEASTAWAERLIALCPLLPLDLGVGARQLAAEAPFPATRAEVLSALASAMPQPEQTEVIKEAVIACRDPSVNDLWRAWLLGKVARACGDKGAPIWDEALAAASTLPENSLIDALEWLAPYVNDVAAPAFAEMTQVAGLLWHRARLLAVAADACSTPMRMELLSKALATAEMARSDFDVAQIITTLSARLSPEMCEQALQYIERIEELNWRREAIGALAPISIRTSFAAHWRWRAQSRME
jgi:hypothetical protein